MIGERARYRLRRVVDPQRIGDEDVLDTVVDEHLGLTDGRDGQADRARLELQQADLRRLVGLGVRPKRDPGGRSALGDAGDVGMQWGDVDPEVRRRRRACAHPS